MLALGLGLAGCGDDAAADGEAGGVTGDTGTMPSSTSTDDGADETNGCVQGNDGCTCLMGQCTGGLFCVEDICVQGPQIDIDEGRMVLAGLVVPLEADIDAEEFAWSQVSGPSVEILGSDTMNVFVPVPADVASGEVITLRLTAMRNGVSDEADVTIEVIEANFENFLSGITDPAELGSPLGIDFDADGMWVVSSEGFVSRFDAKGGFVGRVELAGTPGGADFFGENLLIPNAEGTGRVDQLNAVSSNLSILFDTIIGGGTLGPVNMVLADGEEFVYVSNGTDGRIVRYDAEAGGAGLFFDMPGETFGAMTFGPEDDNMLYVGTAGEVWRIPVDNGEAGIPQDYLDLADPTCQVTGLAFDEGNSMWVGCAGASSLFVAPYTVMGPTAVSRSWSNEGTVSSFTELVFGRDDFGGQQLYYTNATDGTVGRLRVGLSAL